MTSHGSSGWLNPVALRATFAGCLFYAAFGGLLQWFPVWLIDVKGLTGEQIGLMMSIAGVGRVIIGPLTGAWADGLSDRRIPIRLLAGFTTLALGAMYFSRSAGIDVFLALSTEIGFWALIAFIEAALIRLTEPGRFPNYGTARGLASLAFVLGNVSVGVLVDRTGKNAIWWWIFLCLLGVAASSYLMAPEPARRVGGPPFLARLRASLGMVRNRDFVLLMAACGILQAGHQYYYLFGTKLWIDRLGLSATLSGWLFAFGVVMEAGFLMFVAPRIEWARPSALIVIGGLGAILRWTLMATDPGVPLLVFLQALHALSFACVFLGGIRGTQRLWGTENVPTAQLLYMAISNAPAQALASWISGRIYEQGSAAEGYLAMAAISAIGLAAAVLLWLKPMRQGI